MVVNLDNGETLYSKEYNQHIDFLSYSEVSDKIVVKSQKLVQLINPFTL